MTFWQFVSNNITKILGAVTTVLSTLMGLIASGQMDGLMSPESIRWLAVIGTLVGAAITGVGFRNTTAERVAASMETAIKAEPPKQSGFARPSLLALIAVTVLAGCMLVGCGGAKQLYRQAHTPVQYAKTVLLHHNALGEQVVTLRADPLVSAPSKARLLDGYRMTVCSNEERTRAVVTGDCMDGPAQQLEAAAKAYETLSTATTEAELQAAVDTLVGQLVKLITAVNEAK